MNNKFFLTGFAVLAMGAVAVTAIPTQAQANADEVVQERVKSMKAMRTGISSFKRMFKDGAYDAAGAKEASDSIKAEVTRIAELFPEGSKTGKSAARAEVWSDRAGFEKKAAENIALADALIAAVASGDSKAVDKAYNTLSDNCETCHEKYMEE